MYDHCAVGTKVVIFWGKTSDDPIKRPSFTPITNGKFTDWDPTDPDPKNPYKKKVPTVKANKTKIEFGTKVKFRLKQRQVLLYNLFKHNKKRNQKDRTHRKGGKNGGNKKRKS